MVSYIFPRRRGAFCLMPCPALTPSQDYTAVTLKLIFQSFGKGGQKPWSLGLFLCISTTLTLASVEAKCRSNPTTAQTLSPEATRRCNDYSINYSSPPAFHMRDIPPSLFSRDDKPPDKGLEKCQKLRHPFFRNCVTLLQNCIIHHISVKNELFIQHHMTRIEFVRNC